MAYGIQFETLNGKKYNIDDIGPATYLGQIRKTGAGSTSASFTNLIGKAARLIVVPNMTRGLGYVGNVSVNNSSMIVTLNVTSTGGYASGTPDFIYDIYGSFF